MSDFSQGPGWWVASDGKWYPPELHPDQPRIPVPVSQASSQGVPGTSGAAAISYRDQRQEPSIPPTTMVTGPPETDRALSSSRSGRGRLLGVLAVVGVVLVLVVSLVVAFGRSSGGLSGKTAPQVLALTVTAAKAQGSVH